MNIRVAKSSGHRQLRPLRSVFVSAVTFVAVALAPVGLLVDSVWGATGAAYTTPSTSKPSKSGLSLTVDTTWVESRGYRRVRVTASVGKKPLASDKEISIIFKGKTWRHPRVSATNVTEEFLLPAGALTATVDIAVPQQHYWYEVAYDVFVDDEYVEDLSATHYLGWQGNDQWTDAPHVLIVGDGVAGPNALKPLRRAIYLPSDPNSRSSVAQAQVIAGSQNLPPGTLAKSQNTMTLPIADLPDRWVLYSSFDLVCLTAPQLSELAAQHPGRCSALLAWTRSGGSLFIYDVGDEWQRLAAVESVLGLTPTGEDAQKETSAINTLPWHKPTGDEPPLRLAEMNPYATAVYDTSGNLVQRGNTQNGSDDEGLSSAKQSRDRSNPGFAWCDLGLGRVVVLQSDQPLDSPRDAIPWIFGALGADRVFWQARHGLEPDKQNPSFWNLLIPGIGLPPVNAFRILITLFVVVVGPLNFWLLRRIGRPQYLLLTVPGSAAIATLGLFFFAVFSDGLSTRVRARSFSVIDQTSGDEVSWARLSYYAGMRPSGGLQFGANTIVLPLPGSIGDLASERDMEWSGGQSLSHGWLNARTPTQYLTVSSRPTKRRVDVDATDGRVTVTNHLGVRITRLFVMDDA